MSSSSQDHQDAKPRNEASQRTSHLLGRLIDAVSARPGWVVLAALLLSALSITQAMRIEVTTSRTNLGHPASDSERYFGEFLHEFGSPNDLIAVLDGGSVLQRRQCADALATALEQDHEHVKSTFHRVDLHFFLRHMLLFVPVNEVDQISKVLSSSFADDIRAGKVDGLDSVLAEFTSALSGRAGGNIDPARAVKGIDALNTILGELELRLRDPQRGGFDGLRQLVPPLKAGAIDDEGYLQSRDGGLRLVFVRPAQPSDENSVVLPLVESVRATAAKVAKDFPGVRVRITGLPAVQADETVIVDHDMSYTTTVSLVLIAIIMLFGYRQPRLVLLSLLPLGMGILWTLALVKLQYGRVNLVASVFMPILLGRGSDFDTYVISRTLAERATGRSLRDAIRTAFTSAGGGIITGAFVTAAAFLVSSIGQLGAFEQLGVVVALGLMMILLTSLTVTPSLLLLIGDRKLPGEDFIVRLLDKVPVFGAGPGVFGLKRPGLVLGITAAAVIALGANARNVAFDFNLLQFLPTQAESVTAQHDVSARSDYGSDVVVVTADNVDEARKLAAELAKKPSVSRVESIASFLPDQQDAKLAEIVKLRPLVESLPAFNQPHPPTSTAKMTKAVQDLGDEIDDKAYLAEQQAQGDAALKPVVAQLKKLAVTVTSAQKALATLPPDQVQDGIGRIETQVFSLLINSRQLLRENVLNPEKIALDDLPLATRERFIGKTGKSAIYVFAKNPGFGPELESFVHDVRSVSKTATGFPVIYFDSSRTILHSFSQAAGLALLVIIIALLVHFRGRLGPTALSLIPLGVASVAMFGLMPLFGISHNMANIVALPMLLGLGTDYGLQIVHNARMSPGAPLREVLEKTGIGVFIAAATTAAGFGSLALSEHRGAQSLGLVLFLGTIAALLCALVVLPALLELARRYRARKS